MIILMLWLVILKYCLEFNLEKPIYINCIISSWSSSKHQRQLHLHGYSPHTAWRGCGLHLLEFQSSTTTSTFLEFSFQFYVSYKPCILAMLLRLLFSVLYLSCSFWISDFYALILCGLFFFYYLDYGLVISHLSVWLLMPYTLMFICFYSIIISSLLPKNFGFLMLPKGEKNGV